MTDLISREAAIASAMKTRDEARDFGLAQMAMGAAKVADDLRALSSVHAVKVKPLVWESASKGAWGDQNTERAAAFGGWYYMMDDQDSSAGAVFSEFVMSDDDACTSSAREVYHGYCYEAAKTAAQSDYEARILAAIEVTQ